LYVTTSLNGVYPNAQLDGLDQLADEQGPACPMSVECLRHEEQGAAFAEDGNLLEHALEEEKGIFERHILIEKRRAGSQQNDESHLL
jgi:hypothetical protein